VLEIWWFGGLLIAWAFVFGLWAGVLASRRARNPIVWLMVGAIIGPIALIILHVAPLGRCPSCGNATTGWDRQCFWCRGDLSGGLDKPIWGGRSLVVSQGLRRLRQGRMTAATRLRSAFSRISGSRARSREREGTPTVVRPSDGLAQQLAGAPAAPPYSSPSPSTRKEAPHRGKPVALDVAKEPAVHRLRAHSTEARKTTRPAFDGRRSVLPSAAMEAGLAGPEVERPGANGSPVGTRGGTGSKPVQSPAAAPRAISARAVMPNSTATNEAKRKAAKPKAVQAIASKPTALASKEAVSVARALSAIQPQAGVLKSAAAKAANATAEVGKIVAPKADLLPAEAPNAATPAPPADSATTGDSSERDGGAARMSAWQAAKVRPTAPPMANANLSSGPTIADGGPAQPSLPSFRRPAREARSVQGTRKTPRKPGPEALEPPLENRPQSRRTPRFGATAAAAKETPDAITPKKVAPREPGRSRPARPRDEPATTEATATAHDRDVTVRAAAPVAGPSTAGSIASPPHVGALTRTGETTPSPDTDAGDSMKLLTSAVYVGGSGRLMLGERYLIARRGRHLQILGPITENPSRVIVEEPLDSLAIVGANDRLVVTNTRGRGNLALAFQRLAGASAIDVEKALGPDAF
jgi:hypothetical protein